MKIMWRWSEEAPGWATARAGGPNPSLLIRRPMESVRPVRQNPDLQVTIRRTSRLSASVRCCPLSL
jgi:hypothetical protein